MMASLEHVHVRAQLSTADLCWWWEPKAASQLPCCSLWMKMGGEQGATEEKRRVEGRKRKLLWLKWTIIY